MLMNQLFLNLFRKNAENNVFNDFKNHLKNQFIFNDLKMIF